MPPLKDTKTCYYLGTIADMIGAERTTTRKWLGDARIKPTRMARCGKGPTYWYDKGEIDAWIETLVDVEPKADAYPALDKPIDQIVGLYAQINGLYTKVERLMERVGELEAARQQPRYERHPFGASGHA